MGDRALRGGCLALVVGSCLVGLGVAGTRAGATGEPVALTILVGGVFAAAGVLVGLFGLLRWLDEADRRGRDDR